jgi:hypothetical protein
MKLARGLTLAIIATMLAVVAHAEVRTAKGAFEVKLVQLPLADTGDATRNRMSIDKVLHGDLEGTTKGEMLTAAGSEKGSAGYVAIERITGTLQGKKGSFVLQHNGMMNRGTPQLTIAIVPDSGTEELAGIAGQMKIAIAKDGAHSYELEYTLP